jgi:RimJ/RimL family protein N-acetyltransferase
VAKKQIELHPFSEKDFENFKSWVHSAKDLFQFAGPIFTFPVTDEQLRQYVAMKDITPLKVVLSSTQESIGHCELNFSNGNNRLSRILIGKKELRGQKIGEQVVREMVQLLFKKPGIKEVDLNTFSWNIAAINCYKKVGFKINPEKSEEMTVNGQVWTKINMSLKKVD